MANISVDQPRSLFQVIARGFELWRKTFIKILPFALLLGITNLAVQFAVNNYSHQNLYAAVTGKGEQLQTQKDALGNQSSQPEISNSSTDNNKTATATEFTNDQNNQNQTTATSDSISTDNQTTQVSATSSESTTPTAPTAQGNTVHTKLDPMSLSLYLALNFVSLVLQAGITLRMNGYVNATEMGFDRTFYAACRKILPLIGVFILAIIATLAGLILFIIPGVIVAVYIICAYWITVITDKGPVDSMQESFKLVSGNFWRTVGFLIMLFIINVAIMMAFMSVPMAVMKLVGPVPLSPHLIEIVYAFAGSIMIIFMLPLYNASMLSLIYDLQARHSKGKDQGQTYRIPA